MNNKITIILPVYHEQENLPKVIYGIEKFVKTPHVTFAIIQDKKDPSIAIIKQLQQHTPSLKLLYTHDGIGILKAYKEGFSKITTDIIVIMMSDLSDNPSDIDKMVRKVINGCDLVCASRYSHFGKRIGGPVLKGYLSYLACKSLHLLTSLPTNDVTNAFKCFKKRVIEDITIESLQGFEFPLELTLKAYYLGMKIDEIPTIWRDRTSGTSNFNLVKNIPYYLRWYIYGLKKKLVIKST